MSISLLAFVFAFSPAPTADDAKAIAVQLTHEGARTFDRKDAVAMAAFYADDAQIRVVAKEKESGEIKVETKAGRPEVQAYYESLFKGDNAPHSKNNVEHARRIGSDFLLIAGVFQTDLAGDLKIPFVQTRMKKGEKWLITSLEIFLVPEE